MLLRINILGGNATVAYLDDDFEPVDSFEQATMMKLVFDDGRTIWAEPMEFATTIDENYIFQPSAPR